MSPKATAVLVLMLTVVFGVGPHLPELVAGSGMIVAPWIKLLGALLAACGAIVMAQLPAIKVLARADGTASIGGQGVTLGGAPSKPPPPIPRPGQGGHARLRALLLVDAVAFVGILVAAILVSHVLNDSRPRTASPAGCSGAPPTPAQIQNGETIALNLTGQACSVADTTGDAYVVFGCAIAQIAENAAIQVTHLFVAVPAAACPTFAAAHPETATSKALVTEYRATHPAAVTTLKWGVGTRP